MGTDKEKFERIDAIKERATCLVESQINGDVQNVDAKELGEIADIIKDMAETKKLCMEAKYYETVVEAMEDAGENSESHYYFDPYKYPHYPIMYYRDGGRRRNPNGRFMYTKPDMMYPMDYGVEPNEMDYYKGRMYYSDRDEYDVDAMPMYQRQYHDASRGRNSGGNGRYYEDYDQMKRELEGRSGMRRRMYMEMKDADVDPEEKKEELERYMSTLGEDIGEMISGASPEEKMVLKQKLTAMIGKI